MSADLTAGLASTHWQPNPFAKRRGIFTSAAALVAAAIGIAAAVLPWRSIAPIARPDASVYSAATIARGRQLAALGDCAICHTAVNGTINAGGRALETPFGIIYSTNITPDPDTGIGKWSNGDLADLLKNGGTPEGDYVGGGMAEVVRNTTGKMTDADVQAIIAYLKSLQPIRNDLRKKS